MHIRRVLRHPGSRSRTRPVKGAVILAAVLALGAAGTWTALAAGGPAGSAKAAAGSVPGSPAAGGRAVARPASTTTPLTADTAAGCNAAPKPGSARCFAMVRTPASHTLTADTAAPPATALGPADIQNAYKLPATGAGQTVAIVDAFGDSHAEADLAAFRTFYNLPPCTTANGCFKKVDQDGGTAYPADDPGWGLETSLDLDAVSSACPACNILLVQGTDATVPALGTAVDTAVRLGAKFVSNSYGTAEDPTLLPYDSDYDHPGVVIGAATGDVGNVVSWPSSSPQVTAVGGTSLARDSSARGWSESAWGVAQAGVNGGGSGCSVQEPQPGFQAGLATQCAKRATADLAADGDPGSGLATYDTLGQDGWLQVGGTSLATPLVTAMYALAGTPQAGSYPNANPYHDKSAATDLFDVTSGVNGACGNVLCQAGTGWDGPTGLGTPDGIGALSSGPQGVISGTVTDAASGQPVGGATVDAEPGGYVTHADSSGHYTLDAQTGTYTVSATAFRYPSVAKSGVTVTAGQTTTADFALTAAPSGTVSGTVLDGSGHGWPVYAKLTIPGYPGGAVYTDPFTGKYSVTLPVGTYAVHVEPEISGYSASDIQVPVTASATHQDVDLTVDAVACDAPGYGWNAGSEDFSAFEGTQATDGWTVSGSRDGWRFDDPSGQAPPAGGDDHFAILDATVAQADHQDSTLTSPVYDLSGQSAPHLTFDTSYLAYGTGQSAEVQVRVDGGGWRTVWSAGTSDSVDPVDVALPNAAGHKRVQVRFHYSGHDGWWWAVDDVFVGTHTCAARAGGLTAGYVTAQGGAAVEGASVAATGVTAAATSFAVPDDPANAGGYYVLFAPTGPRTLTATAGGYQPSSARVSVPADALARQDFVLTAQS